MKKNKRLDCILRLPIITCVLLLIMQCACNSVPFSHKGSVCVMWNSSDEFEITLLSAKAKRVLPFIDSRPMKGVGIPTNMDNVALSVFRIDQVGEYRICPRRRRIGWSKYSGSRLGVETVTCSSNSSFFFVEIPEYIQSSITIRVPDADVECFDIPNPDRMGSPIAMATIEGRSHDSYCSYFAMISEGFGIWKSNPCEDFMIGEKFRIFIGNQRKSGAAVGLDFEVALVVMAELHYGEEELSVLSIERVGEEDGGHIRLRALLAK